MPAQVNVRYFQQHQIKALRTTQCCQASVLLNSNSKEELQWWIQNLQIFNGRYLIQPQNFLAIRMDASKKGWGAVCQGIPAGEEWNLREQQLQINVLEMKAVKLALLAYHKHFKMKAIHFQIDNTTALSYLVIMGGTKNKHLVELSIEIWRHLLHHGITITEEYLPSSVNVEADWHSRN